MTDIKFAINGLKSIVEKSSNLDMIPHVYDDAVRIKHYLIKSTNQGTFCVIDTHEKIKYKTFTKPGALALAKKLLSDSQQDIDEIISLDRKINKHAQDCVFYQNSIDKSKDLTKMFIIKNRLDVSIDEMDIARKRLKKFIFD